MKNDRPSIDGFIPRRSGNPHAESNHNGLRSDDGGLARHGGTHVETTGLQQTNQGLSRQELDETLQSIDNDSEQDKKRPKKPRSIKKIIKRTVVALLLVGLLVGGYIAGRAAIAGSNIFKGNILGLLQSEPLKQDENGQTNILIVGTSEDDPGHEGADLTDSIMVISVNQEKKTATMFSIPRDLEVEYGMACTPGYSGKINAYFTCVNPEDSEQAEEERQTATRKFIGDIVGLDIQYSARVNYTVMRDVVGALGAISVNIEGSEGAPGIMDSNFDWKCRGGNAYASRATMIQNCPPNGHFIDYPNGPATLDAEHALYLAMARGDSQPTYGLANSNFDREKNQQKIILAIREKALSTGTLTDINKVTGLIDALGNNLRTNFESSEFRTIMSLANDINPDSIQRLDFLGSKIMDAAGQPTAGYYEYSEIQAYIKKSLSSDPIVKESATLAVYNGGAQAGAAASVTTQLKSAGLSVVQTADSPTESTATYEIYDVTKTKSATKAKLQELYGVTVKTTDPPFAVTGVDFVIIIGSAAQIAQ